ncbi:MAG: c-type cytochrome [Pseudomonadota bacterium]
MKIRIVTACVLLIATATAAQAESLIDGSIEAGKAKSMTCGACHGMEGNSLSPQWPNLAGQNAGYIVEQLQAFKDGTRSELTMNPMAMMLSEEDMRNVAVYYESLPAAATAVRVPADMNLEDGEKEKLTLTSSVALGKALYIGGDEERKIPACMSCHGPTGRGNPAANYPSLHGQHASYSAKQLRDYASGARTSDGKSRQMRDIAERLTNVEIEVIASYIQGLK